MRIFKTSCNVNKIREAGLETINLKEYPLNIKKMLVR